MQLTINVDQLDNTLITSTICSRIEAMSNSEFSEFCKDASTTTLSYSIESAISRKAEEYINNLLDASSKNNLFAITKDVLMTEVIKPAIDRFGDKYNNDAILDAMCAVFPTIMCTAMIGHMENMISYTNCSLTHQMADQCVEEMKKQFSDR